VVVLWPFTAIMTSTFRVSQRSSDLPMGTWGQDRMEFEPGGLSCSLRGSKKCALKPTQQHSGGRTEVPGLVETPGHCCGPRGSEIEGLSGWGSGGLR
jgi:hypothetical protein